MKGWDNNKIIYNPRNTKSTHGRNRFILVFALVIAITAGVLYGAYLFLMRESFMVRTATVNGLRAISADDFNNSLDSYLGEMVLSIFPRREFFVLSTEGLGVYLKREFPTIKTIEINKKLPNALTISLVERDIWGVACEPIQAEAYTASSTIISGDIAQCVYIDEDGFGFRQAPVFSAGSLTKKIITDINAVSVGSIITTQQIIKLYDGVQSILHEYTLPLSSLILAKETPHDVRIYSGSWYILVDPSVNINALRGIFQQLVEKNLKGKFSQLEYMDLRFGNKVFLKKK